MTGLLGAMGREIDALVDIANITAKKTIGELTFYEGDIDGKSVVIVRSGIGKVNSAVAAAVMCVEYPIDVLINLGIAGGLVERGELVISDKLAQHDTSELDDYKNGNAVTGFGSLYINADAATVESIRIAADMCGIPNHIGTIVSGDQFIRDSKKARELQRDFGAKAIEMESAAVARACSLLNVRFCAIRTVTDNADETAKSDYFELCEKACETSTKVVRKYLANLK